MPAMHREFALVLLLGAAGAGLVVLAARQAWAQAVFIPPRPLPAQDIPVTGQQLVPLASALALAGLACLAAVIATGSWVRRVAGGLLAVLGAGAVVAVGAGLIVLAGLATIWRGLRWPVMSARFDRPRADSGGAASSEDMWESLSRDVDPTVQDVAAVSNPEDQRGGGTPG